MVDLNPVTVLGGGGVSGQGLLHSFMTGLGWLLAGIILIAAAGFGFWWWWTKKQFNKTTTDFEIVGEFYEPSVRDTAKLVKLGKTGFVVLYLRKSKVYRIASGGKIGKNAYYFFIGRDGYPYNSMLSSNIYAIDNEKGLIPIVTANPTMKAQFTALQKQLDDLHTEKKSWMDKYGVYLFLGGIALIIMIGSYLSYKELSSFSNQMGSLVESLKVLTSNMNQVAVNLGNNAGGANGLVPVR